MRSDVPALHVGPPALTDDRLVEVRVDHSGGVDSVGFDDFEGLGEQGGHGACETGRVETQGGPIFDS